MYLYGNLEVDKKRNMVLKCYCKLLVPFMPNGESMFMELVRSKISETSEEVLIQSIRSKSSWLFFVKEETTFKSPFNWMSCPKFLCVQRDSGLECINKGWSLMQGGDVDILHICEVVDIDLALVHADFGCIDSRQENGFGGLPANLWLLTKSKHEFELGWIPFLT